MKKLVFVIFSMVLFVGLMAGSIGQEAFKLGVVDSNRVLLNYQKAIETDKLLKGAEKRLKEKLDVIGEEIRTLREKKTKSELFLEQPKISDLQKQIEQKTIEHQQEFERGRQALLERSQELMTPIYKQLEELIVKVGKEEKYDLIIDKQAALYFNEKYDITDELIKLINANAEKVAEPKKENAEKPQTPTENAK